MPFPARLSQGRPGGAEPGTGRRDAFARLTRLQFDARQVFEAFRTNAPDAWDAQAAEAVLGPAGPSAPAEDPPQEAAGVGDALQKLADLHARGVLTDEEFEAKKRQLRQGG